MKICTFLSVIIYLSLSGCESPLSKFEVDRQEPRIVLNGLFTQDSLWKVQLSKSKDILSKADWEKVTNAIVRVTDSRGNAFDFKYDDTNDYVLNQHPLPGEKYTIEAIVPGFKEIGAESSLPFRPRIISSVITDSVDFEDKHFYSKLSLVLNDDLAEKNYYELIIFRIDSMGKKRMICFKTNNIAIENEPFSDISIGSVCRDNALFTDELFNGKQFALSIKFIKEKPEEPIYVYLRSCSKPLYDYFLTSQKALGNGQSPYSEPIHVYSNIENGIGIFGGYSVDIDTLR